MEMRYLEYAECEGLGDDDVFFKPYAIYGGKVYSLRAYARGGSTTVPPPELIVHGSHAYGELVKHADEIKIASRNSLEKLRSWRKKRL